jgi:hypothetical protein
MDFPGLPKFPLIKKALKDEDLTSEQKVLIKLINREYISNNDINIFIEAIGFYEDMFPKLLKLDLTSFDQGKLKSLISYFQNALNHMSVPTVDIECEFTYRIIKNNTIHPDNKSITNTSFLKYPPLHIVNKIGKYNRANTPNSNVFYGAESANAALLEMKPNKGELITLSIWRNKLNKIFYAYPMVHPIAQLKDELHPIYFKWENVIRSFLVNEYSKEVNNHFQYIYSAVLSERFLKINDEHHNVQSIVYPSVKNNHKFDNLAIRPSDFDKYFEIYSIYEIIIDETYFQNEINYHNPFEISYIKPYSMRQPKTILKNGKIIW